MGLTTSLDVDTFNARFVEEEYPQFIIKNPNDPLVLILGILIKGDVPLLVEYNNSKMELMRIDISAYNIQMLLDVLDELVYVDEEKNSHTIRSVRDYLEVYI